MPINQRLGGENIAPVTTSQANRLIGAKVTYLRQCDIDTSGRGYFPKYGTVTGVSRKNIELDDNDWIAFSRVVEMRMDVPPEPKEPS